MRIAFIVSHPIQYYVPVYRELARLASQRTTGLRDHGTTALKNEGGIRHADDCQLTTDDSARISALKVFYTWRDAGPARDVKFGKEFAWDIPLMEGYDFEVVPNTSTDPGTHHRKGLINPDLVDAGEGLEAGCGAHHGLQLRVARTGDQGAEQGGDSGDLPWGLAFARWARAVVEVDNQEKFAVARLQLAGGVYAMLVRRIGITTGHSVCRSGSFSLCRTRSRWDGLPSRMRNWRRRRWLGGGSWGFRMRTLFFFMRRSWSRGKGQIGSWRVL